MADGAARLSARRLRPARLKREPRRNVRSNSDARRCLEPAMTNADSEAMSIGRIALAPVANDAYGWIGARSVWPSKRYGDCAMRYVVSTTRCSPTICDRRAYAVDGGPCLFLQRDHAATCCTLDEEGLRRVIGVCESARRGAVDDIGRLSAGLERSEDEQLDARAGLAWNQRHVDPSTRGWNPCPPTMARIAPVLVSSVTTAASNP